MGTTTTTRTKANTCKCIVTNVSTNCAVGASHVEAQCFLCAGGKMLRLQLSSQLETLYELRCLRSITEFQNFGEDGWSVFCAILNIDTVVSWHAARVTSIRIKRNEQSVKEVSKQQF